MIFYSDANIIFYEIFAKRKPRKLHREIPKGVQNYRINIE